MDKAVLDFFGGLDAPGWLDWLMVLFSKLGDYGFVWILCGLILLIVKPKRRTGVAVALALLCDVLVVNLILKNLVARPRPFELYQGIELLIAPPLSYSFPSGHASSSAAASVALFAMDRRLGVPALLLALCISFSRIYLCVHFLSDVAAGLLVGALCAYAARRLAPRIKRIGPWEAG